MPETADVVIIGAGAPGLAVAGQLHEHKREIIVLEARDRIGGRALTLHPDSLAVPVEFGAEFVHGEAPELRKVADRAMLRILNIAENRWMNNGGKLRCVDDFWGRLNSVMRRLGQSRAQRGT